MSHVSSDSLVLLLDFKRLCILLYKMSPMLFTHHVNSICHVQQSVSISTVFLQTMSFTEEFRGLDRDIEGSPKRWKKVVESECPEKEKLPQEWKNKSSLQKLILMRALRPDRMTYALRCGCVTVPHDIRMYLEGI